MDNEKGDSNPGWGRWVGTVLRGCVLLLLLSQALSAQNYLGHIWNLDNRVRPGEFNTLRIHIGNEGGERFDTDLRIYRSAAGKRRGAPILARCFLSPGTRRWITLRPFIAGANDSWVLDWPNRNVVSTSLNHAGAGPRPLLYLIQERERRGRSVLTPNFPRLASAAWPVDQLSLDTLRAAVVDHPLRDFNRRQIRSFLRWLRRGGRLHVLKRDGDWPNFGEGLEALLPESEGESFNLGGGRVIYHDTDGRTLRKELPEDFEAEFITKPAGFLDPSSGPSLHEALRTKARASVDQGRSWGMVVFMTLVYTLLVGPGFWWFCRRDISWWTALGALAATVAAAALLFEVLGARSSDETNQRRSRLYYHYLGEGSWRTIEHSGLFSTKQTELLLRSEGTNASFSSAQINESIDGRIRGTGPVAYQLNMLGSSHRFVAHQCVLAGPKVEVKVSGSASRPRLTLDPSLRLEALYAVYNNRWLRYTRESGGWQVAASMPLSRRFLDESFGTLIDLGSVEDPIDEALKRAYDLSDLSHREFDVTELRRRKLTAGDRQMLLIGVGRPLPKSLFSGFNQPQTLSHAIFTFYAHR